MIIKLKYFFICLFVFYGFNSTAQEQDNYFSDFKHNSEKINRYGMYTLGGWAAGNIAYGTFGWINNSGEKKYYHQMNTLWNTVNLGLAVYGLLSQGSEQENISEFIQKNQQMEKVLLINGGLDLLYMGTGIYLQNRSYASAQHNEQMTGYGKSLVLQGAFLFVFDMALYRLKKNQRNSYFNNLTISPSSDSIGFKAGIIF